METKTPRQSSRPVGPVLLCLILCSLAASPLQAQDVAAKVQFAVGDVSATSANGQTRRLKKGDRIYTGDTVKTGDGGSAQLIYRDRSRMAVRVNTEFKVKEYKYDAKDKKGAISVFSLLGGALRTVSGLIGAINPQRVQIDTPLATIGIRGTDHEVVYINRQISRTKKLKEGTYNKVYAGKTILKTSKGVLNLDLHQTGFVGVSKGQVEKPVKIKDLPAGIKSQLTNKIPVQAKTLPKTDGKKKSTTAKTESIGGNKSNTMSKSGSNMPATTKGGAAVSTIPGTW